MFDEHLAILSLTNVGAVNPHQFRLLDRGKGIHWRWNTRYKNWGQFPCHGKVVRRICINGLGDLRLITTRSELFVNKFHLEYQYLALDCLEQWLYNKTLADYKRAEN